MYIIPQDYKCIKCDYEFKYGPHNTHSAPVICDEVTDPKIGVYTRYMPACPQCYAEFIKQNIGLGYCTVAFNESGSEYDKIKKSK